MTTTGNQPFADSNLTTAKMLGLEVPPGDGHCSPASSEIRPLASEIAPRAPQLATQPRHREG